jgi:hypothetical protein
LFVTNANIEEHLFLWTIIGIIIIVLALLIIGNIATTRLAFAFDLFIKKVPHFLPTRTSQTGHESFDILVIYW